MDVSPEQMKTNTDKERGVSAIDDKEKSVSVITMLEQLEKQFQNENIGDDDKEKSVSVSIILQQLEDQFKNENIGDSNAKPGSITDENIGDSNAKPGTITDENIGDSNAKPGTVTDENIGDSNAKPANVIDTCYGLPLALNDEYIEWDYVDKEAEMAWRYQLWHNNGNRNSASVAEEIRIIKDQLENLKSTLTKSLEMVGNLQQKLEMLIARL